MKSTQFDKQKEQTTALCAQVNTKKPDIQWLHPKMIRINFLESTVVAWVLVELKKRFPIQNLQFGHKNTMVTLLLL